MKYKKLIFALALALEALADADALADAEALPEALLEAAEPEPDDVQPAKMPATRASAAATAMMPTNFLFTFPLSFSSVPNELISNPLV